jgi:hypothetical protein
MLIRGVTTYRNKWLCLLAISSLIVSVSGESELVKSEVFAWKPPRDLTASLVICPGQNESSKGTITGKEWIRYAGENGLALAGYHFESPDELLRSGKGYFVAERGSGKMLVDGLERRGAGDLPIYLYGFSGGAHFAMSFASWAPEKVAGFCAYSFGWSSPPSETLRCPALIVCGEHDGQRYGSTLNYFQEGRRQGKPWVWVSLGKKDHSTSKELDQFVRKYFACLLRQDGPPVLVDNYTKKVVKGDPKDIRFSVLPSAGLLEEWRRIHHP